MIVLIFIIGGYICLLGLWGLFLVIVHLLQYRYNDTGLKFTYFLQARWELYNLETSLRIHQIKKREEIAQRLTPVEDAGYKPLNKGENTIILHEATEEKEPLFLREGEKVIYLSP